jgi:putative transcriptional regulator
MSQPAFAALVGVSAILVQSWERGVRTPATVARRVLDMIAEDPGYVAKLATRMAG